MTVLMHLIGYRVVGLTLTAACLTVAATVVQATQIEKSIKLELIDFAMIPNAAELGWVEVQRRRGDGWGWQCDNRLHLAARHLAVMDRLRRRGSGTVDAKTWLQMSGMWVIERLSSYTNQPDGAFSWRSWLTGMLERINEAADDSGMPRWRKEVALHNWVMCHVSVEEAHLVRRLIDESSPKEN